MTLPLQGWGTGQGLQFELSFFLCWFSLSSFPIFSQARHWPPAMLPPASSADPRAPWLCSLHLGGILGGRGEGEICPSLDLQFFFYSLFMNLQQSFFWLHSCLKCKTLKNMCSHQGGYSQLPWLGTTGTVTPVSQRALHIDGEALWCRKSSANWQMWSWKLSLQVLLTTVPIRNSISTSLCIQSSFPLTCNECIKCWNVSQWKQICTYSRKKSEYVTVVVVVGWVEVFTVLFLHDKSPK